MTRVELKNDATGNACLMRVYDRDLCRHVMTSKVLIELSGIPKTVRK